MYQNLMEKGELCIREVKKRNFYMYNWSVSPSECCKSPFDNIIRLQNQ